MPKTEQLSGTKSPVTLAVGDTISLASNAVGEESSIGLGESVEQFVILRPIGSGGMGSVFLAYDTQLHRRVALKLISEYLQENDGSWQKRLLQEARTMAKVNHAHVVPIHSVGTIDQKVYIAMAYIEGGTLEDWLSSKSSSKPSPRQLLNLILPVGDALQAAHSEGVVHRDIKPQNILVQSDGHAFLTDFGIAVTLASDKDKSESKNKSKSKSPMPVEGTRDYMSPEQAQGHAPDVRSDIYSYCLTLQKALQGRGSRHLRKVLTKGCSQNPEDRHLTMREVQQDLRHALGLGRKRLFWATGTLAICAVLLLLLYRSSSSSSTAMCSAENQTMDTLWNSEREATLRSQFQATGASDALLLADQSIAAINTFTTQWSNQRQQSCEATHVHREQSEEVLIARQQCYDDRLQELAGVFEVLDEETVLRTLDAIPATATLDLCQSAEVLQRSKRSILTGPKAQSIQQSIAQLRALHNLGQYEKGIRLARTLRPQVESLGSEQHLAEFELITARHYKTLYRPHDAWKHLKAANQSAAKAGDNVLIAQVWTQAIFVLGYQLGRNDEAEVAAIAAQAAVEQSRANDAVRSNFLTKLAILRRTQYRWPESEALQREGMSLRRSYYGPTHPLVGKSASNLGNLLIDMGRYKEAADSQKIATDIARQAYGAGNPALADTLANYVSTIMTIGDVKQALPLQKEVLKIFQAAHGHTSKKSLEAAVVLALVHTYLGDFAAAKRLTDLVRQTISEAEVDVNRAGWLEDLAHVEMLQGNSKQSREDLSQVYDLHRQFPGSRHALSGSTDLLSAQLDADAEFFVLDLACHPQHPWVLVVPLQGRLPGVFFVLIVFDKASPGFDHAFEHGAPGTWREAEGRVASGASEGFVHVLIVNG
ncbi:MAG: serine/threonine protein kinase, partial [Kofleriaceae bacterium]|nr:serine/threonine protein kinase [Kofleriaceae bacterium]